MADFAHALRKAVRKMVDTGFNIDVCALRVCPMIGRAVHAFEPFTAPRICSSAS